MKFLPLALAAMGAVTVAQIGSAANHAWYTQGNFAPAHRLAFVVENTLDIAREKCPVVIPRAVFPTPDIHEMRITVVDPLLPPFAGPSQELLNRQGGHQLRAEHHGHALFHQLDDITKDGVWDELFFQIDLAPREARTIHVYFGENIRGWNPHRTHANIGSYCRHIMPFWESENVGWKIWFANSVDVFAKRQPLLMAQRLYMGNLDGYGAFYENHNYGSDIQSVDLSFGGGAVCLFEFANEPARISDPRFTPTKHALVPDSLWNAGQISDTRYAYDVVVNGPVRSMIRIRTMNWDSGHGFYEYDQYYTVYAGQSYTTSKVLYTTFLPKQTGVRMGCGIRKSPREEEFLRGDGWLLTKGSENIKDPESIDERDDWIVPFVGKALIVPQRYQPEYQFIEERRGNHAFRLSPDANNSYEYMLLAAWSEGAVLNNPESFRAYVEKTALEFNNPVQVRFAAEERKLPSP